MEMKAVITANRLIKTDGVLAIVDDITGRDEVNASCPVIVGDKAPRVTGYLDAIEGDAGFPVDVDRLHQILKEFSGIKVVNISAGVTKDGSNVLIVSSSTRAVCLMQMMRTEGPEPFNPWLKS